MCLITKSKELNIAQEDILVYKVLNIDMSSTKQGYQYRVGDANPHVPLKTVLKDYDVYDARVEQTYGGLQEIGVGIKKGFVLCYKEGYHSFKDIGRARWRRGKECLYYSVIPKGSEYTEDETGLCVSSSLTVYEKYKGKTVGTSKWEWIG